MQSLRVSKPTGLEPFWPRQRYIDEFKFVPWGTEYEGFSEDQFGLFDRYKYDWGFFLPTMEVVDELVSIIKEETGGRVLDAGSGSGFLSRELCSRGVSCFAVDRCDYENKERKFGYPIINVYQRDALGDALEFVSGKFDVILMGWPPYEKPFAKSVLDAMLPGQWLIYEGELWGCCADDAFFEELNVEERWGRQEDLDKRLNACHVTFQNVNDCWRVYRKKAMIDPESGDAAENKAWDNMAPVGREFGSPDYERLMEEDAKAFRDNLARLIDRCKSDDSAREYKAWEDELTEILNIQAALSEFGQDVSAGVAATVWKHYSASLAASWMAGADTVESAKRTLYFYCAAGNFDLPSPR